MGPLPFVLNQGKKGKNFLIFWINFFFRFRVRYKNSVGGDSRGLPQNWQIPMIRGYGGVGVVPQFREFRGFLEFRFWFFGTWWNIYCSLNHRNCKNAIGEYVNNIFLNYFSFMTYLIIILLAKIFVALLTCAIGLMTLVYFLTTRITALEGRSDKSQNLRLVRSETCPRLVRFMDLS